MESDMTIEAFDFGATFDVDDKRVEFTARSEAELDILQNLLYERRVLNELVDSLRPDDVFLDVGANIGTHTCLAAATVGEQGDVIAIEPHPENARRLRENVEQNDVDATVCEVALGHATGTTELSVDHEYDGQSGGYRHSIVNTSGEQVQVDAYAGDDFFAERDVPEPTVVKIDVEGAERHVVAGLESTLRDCRLVFCEPHGKERYHRMVDEFERLDFDVRSIYSPGRSTAHLLAFR